MALKGLIIREPWIDEIIAGRKVWELRSKAFHFRGEIALIRKGSGQILGIADLVDCLPALDEVGMRNTINLHRVPAQIIPEVMERGWRVPWVLSNVRRLDQPVRYTHKPGAVITIDLDAEVEAKVRTQLRSSNTPSEVYSSDCLNKPPLALSGMSGDQRGRAMAALPHIGGKSVRSITDDNFPARPNVSSTAPVGDVPAAIPSGATALNAVLRVSIRPTWRQNIEFARVMLGAVAAIVMAFCLLVWMGRLVVLGIIDTLFTWEGLRWLVWAMGAALVAGAMMPEMAEPANAGGTRKRRSAR